MFFSFFVWGVPAQPSRDRLSVSGISWSTSKMDWMGILFFLTKWAPSRVIGRGP